VLVQQKPSDSLGDGVTFACCCQYKRVSQSTDGGFTFDDPVRFSPLDLDNKAALSRDTLEFAVDRTDGREH
jgi:hypothetical protein